MASKLMNVRLGPEDAQVVARLRARGVSVSLVVRKALRTALVEADQEPVDAVAVLGEMLERFPTPANAKSDRPDTRDRAAVRKHIRKRLQRRRT